MIDDDTSLPIPIDHGRRRVSTLERLADVPEEEIWLQKQKSARTRRAYRLDVQHFMRTLGITTPAELRQADHKAVIAWERYMRETEHAAASTIRRRLAALSSLYLPAPAPKCACCSR
jgi:integrase/recombinase XerD